MTTEEKIGIIKNFPFFELLTADEITLFAENALNEVFPPRTPIISQDKPGDGVYILYKGLVRVYMLSLDGKVIPIKIKSSPYIIGIMDVVNNKRASVIETIQETHTLLIPKEIFKKVAMENARVTYALLQLVTDKLRETNMQTEFYFSSTLKDRTLQVLKELAPFFPGSEIPFSQEEIAEFVGATRARVTEVLNELNNEKLISLSQRKVLIAAT